MRTRHSNQLSTASESGVARSHIIAGAAVRSAIGGAGRFVERDLVVVRAGLELNRIHAAGKIESIVVTVALHCA